MLFLETESFIDYIPRLDDFKKKEDHPHQRQRDETVGSWSLRILQNIIQEGKNKEAKEILQENSSSPITEMLKFTYLIEVATIDEIIAFFSHTRFTNVNDWENRIKLWDKNRDNPISQIFPEEHRSRQKSQKEYLHPLPQYDLPPQTRYERYKMALLKRQQARRKRQKARQEHTK